MKTTATDKVDRTRDRPLNFDHGSGTPDQQLPSQRPGECYPACQVLPRQLRPILERLFKDQPERTLLQFIDPDFHAVPPLLRAPSACGK
jgi:hypothetical protein